MILGAVKLALRMLLANKPAREILKKYGKEALDEARDIIKNRNMKKKNFVMNKSKNETVATKLNKTQETFLKENKTLAKKEVGLNYTVSGNKLKIKNDMKTINDFHDFFSPYNPTETFGKRVPTSITTGRLLDKLK